MWLVIRGQWLESGFNLFLVTRHSSLATSFVAQDQRQRLIG